MHIISNQNLMMICPSTTPTVRPLQGRGPVRCGNRLARYCDYRKVLVTRP